MKTLLIAFAVIFTPIFILGMWLLGSYNSMVGQDLVVQNAWAQVETQYQRRFDLVPNLVGATRGAMHQEQAVFGAIAEARTRYAGSPSGSPERVQATQQYESALARLLVVMENYPQLKSLEQVRALTDELAGTENRVLVARDRYNEEVRGWNTNIKRFPRNLIAGMFGFEAKEFFKPDEGSENAPKVDLTS